MAKKEVKREVKQTFALRIQSVIDDIRRECDEEVSALKGAKETEVSKAVFTFAEIGEAYDHLLNVNRACSYNLKAHDLYNAIERMAESK